MFIIKTPASKKGFKNLRFKELIASGGAGKIFKTNFENLVAKIYITDEDKKLYENKVLSMLSKPPKGIDFDKKLPQLAWPVGAIYEKKKFQGFLMPEIDFKGTVSLERMLQKKMRKSVNLPEFYGYRISVAYNLAACILKLHNLGYYVIDFKPVNCRLNPKNMNISIIDCDGFSILDKNKKRHPSYQYTPEYIAPEAKNKKPEDLGLQQDNFCLAVIIFRLLNNGLHPFQSKIKSGKNLGTIQDLVNKEAYGYGIETSKKFGPAVQSIHEFFPKNIRELFDNAFMKRIRPTAREWVNILRDYANPSSGKLIKCDVVPNEHAHFGLGCGFCALVLNNRVKPKLKSKKKVKANNLSNIKVTLANKTQNINRSINKNNIAKLLELKSITIISRIPFFVWLILVIVNMFLIAVVETEVLN